MRSAAAFVIDMYLCAPTGMICWRMLQVKTPSTGSARRVSELSTHNNNNNYNNNNNNNNNYDKNNNNDGGKSIRAINSWAVPVIRYTAGIVDWTQAELDDLDRKTRKLMTANHALHPQSDVDRLYLPRQTGGRGLLQVKQTVEEEKRALNDYIKNRTEN